MVIVEADQNEKKESVNGGLWDRGPKSWDSGSKSLRNVKQTSGMLEIWVMGWCGWYINSKSENGRKYCCRESINLVT